MEPRCFPHAVPTARWFKDKISAQLEREEYLALEKIDRGFPLESWANDTREAAYGGKLWNPNVEQRLGLDTRRGE